MADYLLPVNEKKLRHGRSTPERKTPPHIITIRTCARTLLGPNIWQCSIQFIKLVTLDEAHVLCLAQQL